MCDSSVGIAVAYAKGLMSKTYAADMRWIMMMVPAADAIKVLAAETYVICRRGRKVGWS